MARRAEFLVKGLDALPAEARARNGEYKGTLPVRVIPPGLTGEDLRAIERAGLAVGQIWLRGDQRVRVLRLYGKSVEFVELTHGHARRSMPRLAFLRHGRLEVTS